MGGQRVERVREAMKQEVSDIIRKQMKDPRIGFVSVTDVEVSGDLRYVKVYVSVLGDEQAKESSMEALRSATGFIRTEIGRRIRLHHTPEISFHIDESIERGVRIFKLLKEVSPSED